MKLTRLAAITALAMGNAAAHASDLGMLDLSTGSAYFGNTPTVGAFVDTATFTLAGDYLANGSLTAVVNGNQDVDFSSVVISGPSGDTYAFGMLNNDPVEVWALPAAGATLAAGTYTLRMTGTNSAGAGSYGGNLAVSAVPEPAQLALMLAGLGALGVTVARRKR